MDHVFVLRHLIEATHFRREPMFCCFVDFRKAYDMVRRDLLVKRLAELGVHGSMLQAIVQMYWDAPLVPKAGTAFGPEIPSQCGVKQGGPCCLAFSLMSLSSGYVNGFLVQVSNWVRSYFTCVIR